MQVAGPTGTEAYAPAARSAAASDSSAFLTDYLRKAGSYASIGGTHYLDAAVTIPDSLRSLELRSTAQIIVRGNHSAFTRSGSIQFREHLPTGINAGSDRLSVSNAAAYIVGEYLLISGTNVVSSSQDRYGYIRRVVTKDSSGVTLDKPVPRTIDQMPRTSSVKFSPSCRIYGSGQVLNENAADGLTALISAVAVVDFRVDGIDVHHNGATGISVAHCLGGQISCVIRDLLDDGSTYFGYGVSVAGATRELKVSGTISRVRHSVTTNPGPLIDSVGRAGEPEDCIFAPLAVDCTDKSVDTHRLGWNTTIVPNVVGGRGGVQIRADNTKVIGGKISNSAGPGVSVSPMVEVPPEIRDVSIVDLRSSGTAVLSSSPSTVVNVTIRNCFGHNIVLSDGCTVQGGSISAGNPVGVSFLGSNNSVTDIQLGESVTTPYLEAPGATNNLFTTLPPADIEPLPAPVCTVAPAISGTAQVGQQLTSGYGTWSQTNVTLRWTWTRDGSPISGAVGRTYPRYDVSAADLGGRIGVVVEASKPGFTTGSVVVAPTEQVAPAPPLVATSVPTVTGDPRVGSYLTANRGTWSPSAQSTSVEWIINGLVIAGLTTNTYRVRSTDVGKTVSIRVTARRTGWIDGVAQSTDTVMRA